MESDIQELDPLQPRRDFQQDQLISHISYAASTVAVETSILGNSMSIYKYICIECGKRFIRKSDLKKHTLIHSDVKNYECGDCGRTFNHKGNFRQHMRTHRRAKTRECEKCGKMLTWRSTVTKHIHIHTGNVNSNSPTSCEAGSQVFVETGIQSASKRDQQETSASSEEQVNVTSNSCAASNSIVVEAAGLGSNMNCMEQQDQSPSSVRSYEEDPEDHLVLVTGNFVHSEEKKFECPECGNTFKTKSKLVEHALKHSNVKTFECQECGKEFTRKSNLTRHASIHSGAKNFECEECGKTFNQKANLNHHMLTHLTKHDCAHSSAILYECQKDPKNHLVTGSSAYKEENFKCSLCWKIFKFKSKISEHTLRHNTVKNFACQVCGKKFTHKSNLNRHTMIHTGLRNHECEECGKQFYQKGNLNQHMLTHLGDRNYECEMCGEKFALKSSLIKHSCKHTSANDEYQESGKIHTEKFSLPHHINHSDVNLTSHSKFVANSIAVVEATSSMNREQHKRNPGEDPEKSLVTEASVYKEKKKLEYQDCEKTLKKKSKLADHAFRNSGVRNYECDDCGKKFSYQSNLIRHVMIHNGVRKYQCANCGKRFSQKGNLDQHMLTHG